MKALDRALLRDLGRLRAQVLTLSLVVACGAGVFVAMKLTVDALDGARTDYFRAQRFGDLFGGLKRAPRALLADLAAVDGVARMLRAPLEAAFDVGGAFNDLAVQLAPGAVRADVIAALDRRLAPFGGHGVYVRADQQSFKMLDERIGRLRGMLVFIPGLF